jgi:hypothetical protein
VVNATDTPHPEFDEKLFKAYEDGKHRRYNLLFAVNGGAFAVAKLLGEKGAANVGKLTMDHLAVGMILFTAVMSFDILAFGWKMRSEWKKSVSDQQKISRSDGLFAWPGWSVLVALWLLISGGWFLVAVGSQIYPRTEGDTMQVDITELVRLNEEIGEAENLGDLRRLGDIVASELAFQRRDGSIVGRDTFLKTPNPGNRATQIESVLVYRNRAVVTCLVTASGAVTHNIRLFVKVGGKWQLLGWANEPA